MICELCPRCATLCSKNQKTFSSKCERYVAIVKFVPYQWHIQRWEVRPPRTKISPFQTVVWKILQSCMFGHLFAVADLHSKILDARPLHFYAVFGTFWPKNRLALPFRLQSPHLPVGNPRSRCCFGGRESWIDPSKLSNLGTLQKGTEVCYRHILSN